MSTTEDEIILEPGDPGYEAPAPPTVPPPPPQDLQHVRNPGETDAEFLARTRGAVVDSQSPSDIVPNQPQITFSPQEPEPEPEPEPDPEPGPDPEPESAPAPAPRSKK